jgi:tRNA(fMet)-specific endonuclease VapC
VNFVLDTTAFSAFMRRDGSIMQFFRLLKPGQIASVPPVVAETQFGIARLDPGSKRRLLLEAQRDRLLAVIEILPWLPESSARYGTIKADLERRGLLIEDFDIAIAAIALSHDRTVVTANTRHFERIDGLTCTHWGAVAL